MTESKRSKISDENREEAARLLALWDRREPKTTQAEFGEAFGLGNQANVGHYLHARSALNPKAAAAFARGLRCRVEDFSPRVARELSELGASGNLQTKQARSVASNVDPGPDLKGLVPLISWIQAGDWHGAEDPLAPGEAEMWMPSPVKCSPGSFALRVRGDSMTAAHGNSRSYPEGSIIFVDPERCMPANGDRIVAKLIGTDDVTFKVYKNEDGRQWLQPLNPTHEPIRDQFRVIGAVVGTWMPE